VLLSISSNQNFPPILAVAKKTGKTALLRFPQ
jgi:hypothetical protein